VKKAFYILLFAAGFLIGFIYTFPAQSVVGYFLSKKGVSYSRIEGNLLHLKVKDLTYGNIYLPELRLDISLFSLKFTVDKGNFLDFNFLLRKGLLKLEDLNLEKYQKRKEITGLLSGDVHFRLKDSFVAGKGEMKLYLTQFRGFKTGRVEVDAKLKPEERYTLVDAVIKGGSINGIFKGRLKINVKNPDKTEIEGQFNGELFGRKMNEKLKLKIFGDIY